VPVEKRAVVAIGVVAVSLIATGGDVASSVSIPPGASCKPGKPVRAKLVAGSPRTAVISTMRLFASNNMRDGSPFPFRTFAAPLTAKVFRETVHEVVTDYGFHVWAMIGAPAYLNIGPRCLRQLSPHYRRLERRTQRQQAHNDAIILAATGNRTPADIATPLDSNFPGKNGGARIALPLSARASLIVGVVPDNVATVTLSYGHGETITVNPGGDVYEAPLPLPALTAITPAEIILRSASGQTIADVRAPRHT
jgi:hypothetical protein